MSTVIWTTISVPGFHRWPTAPQGRDYLRSRHRHLFRITAWVTVSHDDRDTEFHDLQDLIRGWWGPNPRECGSTSCEGLARSLLTHLDSFDIPVVRVEVSEDGESGAIIQIERQQ